MVQMLKTTKCSKTYDPYGFIGNNDMNILYKALVKGLVGLSIAAGIGSAIAIAIVFGGRQLTRMRTAYYWTSTNRRISSLCARRPRSSA